MPIDIDGQFADNVNNIVSRLELIGFRVLNFLMMDGKGDGGALSSHLDNMGGSFDPQMLTWFMPGPAPKDLAEQLKAQ